MWYLGVHMCKYPGGYCPKLVPLYLGTCTLTLYTGWYPNHVGLIWCMCGILVTGHFSVVSWLLECLFLKGESSLAPMVLCPVGTGSLSWQTNTSFTPASKEDQSSYLSIMCGEIWGIVVLKIWPGEPGTEAPIMAYWACSISNAIGPACGMLALKYISYPAQVCMVFYT
jgi:hypothetical protein